jgi:hypothetical protein
MNHTILNLIQKKKVKHSIKNQDMNHIIQNLIQKKKVKLSIKNQDMKFLYQKKKVKHSIKNQDMNHTILNLIQYLIQTLNHPIWNQKKKLLKVKKKKKN